MHGRHGHVEYAGTHALTNQLLGYTIQHIMGFMIDNHVLVLFALALGVVIDHKSLATVHNIYSLDLYKIIMT